MNTRIVALAVAATLGLGSVAAFAQDYRHYDGRQSGWQHQPRDHGGRGQWADHQRYAAPRYDHRSYGYDYGYRHDNGNVVGALVLGTLAGSVLAQAANPYAYAQPPAYYAPPPGYYAPPPAYSTPGYGYGYGYYGN
ncbi:hypothetical protein JJB11_14425 [Ramlibacter ginsenosidimutans]|uniref:Sulfur globule protein CV1 n=1 Tax=Ramlibacter ginsenosidimutans TaxID=502333 RepID=A0A934WN86_9BURK|nr:hypothetical protein [Ramlibacter ginsenosidimutans]MBK6007293.1 hypothetical protein [Ramlibacter ginsenosidimutans]